MNERGTKRKKKSFLQQSMKYHKKGIHGKGVRVDDESYEYFLNVLKIMNQDFESPDDKKVFVENVFGQLEGNEVNYSCNQVVSRVVDNLLPDVSEEILSKFMNTFYDQLRPVCMDPFASFVLQKLIITVSERYLNSIQLNNSEDKSEGNKSVDDYNWLLKVAKYVLNNLEEFVFSNYPNRVMRTVAACLVAHTKPVTEETKIVHDENIPKEFTKLLKGFADQLLQWPRFSELPFQTISSGFLQVILQCLASFCPKRVKNIGVKLLNECFAPKMQTQSQEEGGSVSFSEISPLFDDEAGTRLLEVLITTAPPKLFTQIYSNVFYNRLGALACHPKANFCVQKLLRFCAEKTEFEAIFDELSASLDKIMECGKSGVMVQLCEGCLRHKSKQSVFMQLWMKYLECDGSKEVQSLVTPLTIYMKRKTQFDQNEERNIQLHGSLLLQNILKFNKPIKVISSLLEIKPEELCTVLSNPKGCHIADAFFESEFVGEKSKEKFFKTVQGYYTPLATSKHGSRVFDIVWKWASVKNRALIASELLDNEAKLSNSSFGRPIIYNISLGTFRRNKDEWMRAQSGGDKAKKLFENIVQ